jgi:hypothetical protein
MTVILCHSDDAAALWLAASMRQLGAPADIVTLEQLVFSRRLGLRLDNSGDAGGVELSRGRFLRLEAISGLVNRVRYLPTQHFERAAPAERAYAESELSAFVLAWIHGVPGRIINPPLPFDLGRGTFVRPTLLHHAAMAGLPTGGWLAKSDEPAREMPAARATHTVVVLDGRLFGPLLPRRLQDGCRGLASLLGTPLLQVDLQHSALNDWRFLGATGIADFRIGGKALVQALTLALSGTTPAREAA